MEKTKAKLNSLLGNIKTSKYIQGREIAMKGVFIATSCISVVALLAIFIFLMIRGVPAIAEIGLFNFLFGTEWHIGRGEFGISAMIVTSLVVMLMSTTIGASIGILMAVFIFKYCPKKIIGTIRQLVNLLAGIPSVIFGLFGLLAIIPFFTSFQGITFGTGILTASLVLSMMIMPTVVAITLNALLAVPREIFEGALALGVRKEQAIFKAVLPAAKSGVMAAIVLAVARAIGETMAVIMVIGGSVRMPPGLFGSVESLTAAIARGASYASGMHLDALIGIGVVLFCFSLLLNCVFMYFKQKGKQKPEMNETKRGFKAKMKQHGKIFWYILTIFTGVVGAVIYLFSDEILFPFRWVFGKIGLGIGWGIKKIKQCINFLWTSTMDRFWSVNNQIKVKAIITRIIVYIGAAIVLVALLGIVVFILARGLPHISLHFLFGQNSLDNPSLRPAFIGTLAIVGTALAIAAPIGVGTAIFLSEYACKSKLVNYIRMAIETLAGIPSIVYGLFGFIFFVIMLGMGQTLLGGALTVSIMILPVLIRTTEESLLAVPRIYREGSFALGASKVRTTFKIVVPSAIGGVVTAIILSIGRIIAESAALLMTIGMVTTVMPTGLLGPGTTLSLNVYYYGMTNQNLAAATGVVLLVFVLLLNLAASGLGKVLSRGKK